MHGNFIHPALEILYCLLASLQEVAFSSQLTDADFGSNPIECRHAEKPKFKQDFLKPYENSANTAACNAFIIKHGLKCIRMFKLRIKNSTQDVTPKKIYN